MDTQQPVRKVTINDVAAAAGVSRQTVTRAMNGQSDISARTRERVQQVAAELGYRPSRFARNLVARKKSLAVGLVVASFRNPYFTDMAGDVLECAEARGWQVVMTSSERAEIEALETLSTQVDAVIGHFDATEEELLAAIGGLPLVLLERPATLPGVHCVEVDLRAGMQSLISELRERGARRIGMIDSAYSMRAAGRYLPSPRRGYFEEFADPDSAQSVVVGTETIAGGAEAFTELVREFPDVDTVVVFNDFMALGALQAAHALGLEVPGRVRIVGIDGLSLGLAVSPLLSTLAIDRHAMAEAALAVVADVLAPQGAQEPRRRVIIPRPQWRESA